MLQPDHIAGSQAESPKQSAVAKYHEATALDRLQLRVRDYTRQLSFVECLTSCQRNKKSPHFSMESYVGAASVVDSSSVKFPLYKVGFVMYSMKHHKKHCKKQA